MRRIAHCNFFSKRSKRTFRFSILVFVYLQIAASYRFACRTKCRARQGRNSRQSENSRGAAARRGRVPSRVLTLLAERSRGRRSHCEIRKRARKSGEFPEQCVVSIRVSVGVAMRWTLVQLREQGGEKAREKREDLSVAKLPATSFTSSPSRRLATPGESRPPYFSTERPSRPLRPLLLLQIYKISYFVIELSRS